jgi:transcriptional regulator with XRE-family HTH domain
MGKGTGFGHRLKALREAEGWSLDDLAERSGVHRQSIWKMEQGQREPSWPTVLALAGALGVTPNDFVYRVDTE